MTSVDYHIVIPARYASERLPGKVLLDLGGQSMLQRVWNRARQSSAATVVIATDDERIEAVATGFGAQVVMTRGDHSSGSDRIAECAGLLGWSDEQLVINLQGDEPQMPPACLDQVASLLLQNPGCDVASLFWPISDIDEVNNPNVVKVVTDRAGCALYFSRCPVPYARSHDTVEAAMAAGMSWKRHLGLYAYRLAALRRFTHHEPTALETAERLEQLRVLENGGRIVMARACEFIPAGIDTREDLDKVRENI